MISRQYPIEEPDKPAFIMSGSGEVVTRIQLENSANQAAHLMRDSGLKTGDSIAIFIENHPKFLEICCAAARSGLLFTPISTHLNVSEIEYILKDCEAKLFFSSRALGEKAAEVVGLVPGVKRYLMIDGAVKGFESYEEEISAYPTEPIGDEKAGQDMLYSSGTTGRPKGIKRPFLNLEYGELSPGAQVLGSMYDLNEDTVYLSPAPLYHAAPLRFTLLTMFSRGTVVVMEKFDAYEALKSIEKYRITLSQFVPTMFIRMLKLPEEKRNEFDVSSLKMAIHAAAPIPIEIKEMMIDWWGPILFEYYAGTEANGSTAITSEEWMGHKGSVGKSMVGTIHILAENGEECPVGQTGSIYIENGLPFEYHNDPQKTAESRSDKGWTTIGDVGYLDEDGYLYLTDRKSHMIISGGVNIYPQEAENVLVVHPKVSDVAVIGVPNEEFGEEVKAVVQLENKEEAGLELEQELIEYCRSKLSKIKCPVSVDFVSELPRTDTGKLVKRLLRQRYWAN